ncbi:MFS transporter [Bradyrhizobium jicamae]|uniref:MFS transporter n=1 Tax=Bradyrhizobium jicamae TaxID=280332 RepID=A0ABS5FHD3_9BRAD|nr:MFS transporter [Bradyrhizobium jicamae]MBR0796184.1 MFS transporter [Bradyrhizobium jicamae]MBR0937734.1 MFS transporter [Bradyrhizobium jicamae]
MITDPPKTRLFYGWFVVAAAFVVTFIGFGSAYTFSSFVDSLQRDFGASRGSVSLVFSFAGFLYFGLGMISGPLADRWGARNLGALGMVLVGLGLGLASQAQTIVQVYAAYSIGIGAGVGCAYVPTLGAVQRFFVKRRGFASGLAVSGIGVGTLVMPPLATWLIATLGWRDAYLVLGIGAAAIGVGSSLLIADDPRRFGTGPDGDPLDARAAAPTRQGVSIREAVRTARFAGLYAACLISAFGVFVPFVHLVPYAVDHQVTPGVAVLLLGMIGIGSTAGRFFLGGIADRVGRDTFLVAMYIGMAVSLAIWAGAGGFRSLAVFALLFGLFYGGWVAILPAVVTDHFGGRNVGGIIGILYTSVAIGTLLGPSAAGFAFDISHSYFIPVAISAAANAVAALIAAATMRSRSPVVSLALNDL